MDTETTGKKREFKVYYRENGCPVLIELTGLGVDLVNYLASREVERDRLEREVLESLNHSKTRRVA